MKKSKEERRKRGERCPLMENGRKKKKRVISAEGKKGKGRRRNKCPRAVEGS